MAEKRRFLDVWIVEANTVYKEVPFDVVADWVQQGRLLEDDMAASVRHAEWLSLGDLPDFAAYLPQAGRADARRREPGRGRWSRWRPASLEAAARRRGRRRRYDPAHRRQPGAAHLLHADHQGRGRRRLAISRRRRPSSARSSTPRTPCGSASTSRVRATTARPSTRSASATRRPPPATATCRRRRPAGAPASLVGQQGERRSDHQRQPGGALPATCAS